MVDHSILLKKLEYYGYEASRLNGLVRTLLGENSLLQLVALILGTSSMAYPREAY